MAKHYDLHLIHILFSGPLLMYVGYAKPENIWIYRALLATGITVCIMFAYKMYVMRPWSERHVWFALHAVVFAGLLIYVGLKGTSSPQVAFSLLLTVGIAAFGYHLVRMIG